MVEDLRGGERISTVLITGAAGSLGRDLVRVFADSGYTVRAMDINEAGLAALKRNNVRLLYGDIRDRERVDFAVKGVDVVVHTAALKNLEISEYNIEDVIKTNIVGTLNIAKSVMEHNVRKTILISSDKAVEPVNIYGSSKDIGEKTWLWGARVHKGPDFMILRCGNFIGSSGSCFEVWDRQREFGERITVTDMSMERYFISTENVAACVLRMVKAGENGRIYIPKMPEKNIYQLAMEYTGCESKDIVIIGSREGERPHEKLYSQHESTEIKDKGDYYVI